MVMKHYRVMIVDDHPLMRRGIKQLLALDPLFNVVAEAGNGSEAIALAQQHVPDVILLDLNMKGMSGLDTLKALRDEGVDARIIVLTVSDARSDLYALIDAGADGYLLKDSEPELLLDHIRAAAEGQNVISEAVADYLLSRSEQHDPFSELTERELDVLQEVARGMSNKQVAAQLHISEETVKVHIRNMLRKLDVRSRVAATVMYLEHKSQ
ncbi:nitrate/nitrite response regulator protein NarP [Serratia entomophila]|uniref:nitrate/nitrite response regulator protein NarP n=1 Tax=Serratia entomophila TaxID=42906 RepID=UPI002177759F|nr:nitrate/nitrite response regulator protein NarP [Serratia entomophila]CAI1073844.1 Nitrate/nitrite response regulator protein narL [Serratia entomophila]CAI1077252.1 Nitrate/nitrite response regulator protein narL [Serratia entomophila]CAI1877245.1 Nitrate/nitrite response regulator protein narL [Serratia entomophila]CAI1889925.1 Nitrate/nitrite response regulator protein narL [Serratia entomophila]CAI1903981.1 Nitrate/nitrite response regulator protein narL [Serratia entomophila]